jgi:hypothetical protein
MRLCPVLVSCNHFATILQLLCNHYAYIMTLLCNSRGNSHLLGTAEPKHNEERRMKHGDQGQGKAYG